MLLGQLAIDLEWQGQKLGDALPRHALIQCVKASQLIGGRALVVNALDEGAAGYWARLNFVASKDDPLILYRSMADIAASLEAVSS